MIDIILVAARGDHKHLGLSHLGFYGLKLTA